nr:sodium/iodide cotransporter-like isoform X2 [Rhipicephalus microplus]
MAQLLDYVTFLVLTGTGLAVGAYFSIHANGQAPRSTHEVFLGSKSLRMLPLAMSVLATVGSATGIIGLPAHMYAYGWHIGWLSVSNIILIPLGASVVMPVLYKLNITSVFQYIRMRYDRTIAVITSLTYIMLSQAVGAIALYASAEAASTLLNFHVSWCSLAIGLAATAYTSLGGIRGVVWADCLQAMLTICVPVLIIVKVATNTTSHLRPLSEMDIRSYLFNITVDFSTNENTWAVIIASSSMFLNRICFDQGTVQRYLASRTLEEAKLTLIVGTLMTCAYYALLTGAAIALTCKYSGCDPHLLGSIERIDQLIPFFITQELSGSGISGIFLAGVVSASISTVSSMVNSQAALWYFDIITPLIQVTNKHVGVTLTGTVGVAMTVLSVAIPYAGSAVTIFIAVNAAITGPFVGLFLLAITVPFASCKGAGIATLLMVIYQVFHLTYSIQGGNREQRMPVSLDYCPENSTNTSRSVNITLITPSQRHGSSLSPLDMSTLWSSFFSTVITYLGGILASLLIGSKEDHNSNLTSPILVPLWQWLRWMPPKVPDLSHCVAETRELTQETQLDEQETPAAETIC